METPMRPVVRLVLVAVLAGPVVAACSSVPDLDSISEMWDTKKKLAGDRKPVFPEGVPGVSSGVPPELMKGYRETESGVADPARAAANAAAESEKPKRPPPQRTAAAKPKPKPAADSSAHAQQPPPQQPAQTQPWPAQQQQQQQPAWPSNR
jgi:hypothetical protein